MIGSSVEHVVERLEQGAVLIQKIRLTQEVLRRRIVPAHDEEIAFGSHDVANVVRDVEVVGDHDGLRHEIEDLVGVNEFGSLLQVEDARVHTCLEAVLELEVAGEVLTEELVQLILHIISGAAVCEREVIVLSVDGKVFGHDVVELVDHRRHCLDLVGVDLAVLLLLRRLLLFFPLVFICSCVSFVLVFCLRGLLFFDFLLLRMLLGHLMKLLLSIYLELDVVHLSFKRLFELGLDFIEALLEFMKCLLFHHYSLVILLQAVRQVREVLHLLLRLDLLHLLEDGRVLLLQRVLVDSQLLLAEHERLVLLLNFVDQIRHQLLQFLMRVLDLLLLALIGEVAALLVLLQLQDKLKSILQLLLVIRLGGRSLCAVGLLGLGRFLCLRLICLLLIILFLLIVFSSIMHLCSRVSVLIRVKIELI